MSHDENGEWIGDKVIGNMTLDEATENDSEMVQEAIKNADRYFFNSPEAAVKFIGRCIGSTLEYLGLPNAYNIHPKMLDKIQRKKQIRIEKRNHYDGEYIWRNGIYIYQKDILVAFISDIFVPKKSKWIVSMAQADQWIVITNAKLK